MSSDRANPIKFFSPRTHIQGLLHLTKKSFLFNINIWQKRESLLQSKCVAGQKWGMYSRQYRVIHKTPLKLRPMKGNLYGSHGRNTLILVMKVCEISKIVLVRSHSVELIEFLGN